jgi:hypothetical protein
MCADFSKCCGNTDNCPRAHECARKTAPAGEHQSYFVGDGGIRCPYFIDNAEYTLDGVKEEPCRT